MCHLRRKCSKHQNPNAGRESPLPAVTYRPSFTLISCVQPATHPWLQPISAPCAGCWLRDEQGGGLLSVCSLPGQLPRPTQPPLHPLRLLSSSWGSSSRNQQQQRRQQRVHYKEELQHLSLALAAFSVHPVRISRNLESYDNMEHQKWDECHFPQQLQATQEEDV